ncbi:MAG: MraY family glycosyltransferase [Gammaproteobacteria bacterium]
MTDGLEVMLLAAVSASSFAATGIVRRRALSYRHLDEPGPRSSHATPTPNSGGVALVAVYLSAIALLRVVDAMAAGPFIALFGGGAAVAAVGLWDDRSPVSAWVRVGVHIAACGWAIYWLGGIPALPLGDISVEMGPAGFVVGVIASAWLLNLYNFMDGIDGLAAIEAITVLAGACLIIAAGDPHASFLCLGLLAAAAFGFLPWNWPPARIFMGDIGSGFLGFGLAVLAIDTAGAGALSIWSWIILMGVFIVDATVTLVRRMISGQQWYLAHRSHAYQHAAVRCGSHQPVTLAVLAIDVVWLLPLAWYVNNHPDEGVVVVGLALAPLIMLALVLDAGRGG